MMVARAGPNSYRPLRRRTRIELAQPFEAQALEHAMDGRRTSFRSTSAGLHGRGVSCGRNERFRETLAPSA